MAEETKGTKIDLAQRITLYAPVDAPNVNVPHHQSGEEVKVGVMLVEKFKSLGFTEEKPTAKKGGQK